MPDRFEDYDKVKILLEEAQEADDDNRKLAKEAHLFVSKEDGQWEPERVTKDDKPRYTFDQTTPIIDQISGDIDQSDFDIQVSPTGNGASKETAKLFDGIIRNIETNSNAQRIYSYAGRQMVTAGLDGWMLTTRLLDDNSFDQDLAIDPIYNYTQRVWHDPAATRQDKSDSRWGFLLSEISEEVYTERWPDGKKTSVDDMDDNDTYCTDNDGIVIGHFFYETFVDRELIKTSLGRVFPNDDKFKKVKDDLAKKGETIDETRTIKDRIFFMRIFDGTEWLTEPQKTVFSWVPLIPCYGNYKILENKTIYHGVVKKLMDPQRVLNYSLSREIEEGALAPRAKYWMTTKQAAGNTDTLETLNTNADPVQFYTADGDVPPPTQQGGATINPGLRNISMSMQELMGSTAGIFAAGMGNNPNAQSGIAIERLQDKSNNVSSKYFKSLEVAICHTARVLTDAIPKVYDSERQIKLVNSDGSFTEELINVTEIDQETQKPVIINDLSQGNYGVTCEAAPSFDSRQSQTVSAILELGAIDPSVLQLAQDVLLSNMKSPGMDKIAERSRKQLLTANIIPETQMTEEELQQLELAKQQPKEKTADMVFAEAEATKAEAEQLKVQLGFQTNQLKMIEAQNKLGLEIEKIGIAKGKLQLEAQQNELDFAEKIAKFDKDADQQQFDQLMAIREQQRQSVNDLINNLNTQADTLGKLVDAISISPLQGPGNAVALFNQTREVIGSQEQTP